MSMTATTFSTSFNKQIAQTSFLHCSQVLMVKDDISDALTEAEEVLLRRRHIVVRRSVAKRGRL